MIPIDQLLNRIKWDKEFGRGVFEIGYYDRVADTVIRVPLSDIMHEPDRKDSFLVMDRDGETHRIPYHRIKEVYKDNKLIWQRP